MTPLATFIQTTTYEMTPSPMRLPPFIWTAFSTLNKIHGVWRWFRRIELYRNPDNLAQLLAGHVVNFVIGDIQLLRIAAQCLLISTRILECVQQQAVVCRSGRHWVSAINGYYPPPIQDNWDAHPIKPWKTSFMPLWDRIKRIAVNTFSLLANIFKLSMCIMDAIDAFCFSPCTRNEGLNEGFVNVIKWLDTLVDNKEELLQGMVENREIIEKILAKSPFTYIQLHDGVTNAIEKTEIVAAKAKKITSFGNGILCDIGKRMASGIMVVIGLPGYRPAILADRLVQ